MPTPFGALYTPNITPDPDTGIGKWTADDFWRALHEGKSKDGSFLYPAMPVHQLHQGHARGLRRDVRVLPVGQAGAPGQPAARRWAFPTTSASCCWAGARCTSSPACIRTIRSSRRNGTAAPIWSKGSAIATPATARATCWARSAPRTTIRRRPDPGAELVCAVAHVEPRNRPRRLGHQGDRRSAAHRRVGARRGLRADVGGRAAQPAGDVAERPDGDGDLSQVAERRPAKPPELPQVEDDRRADRRDDGTAPSSTRSIARSVTSPTARACRGSIRRWRTTSRSRWRFRSTRSASCSMAAFRRAPKATRVPTACRRSPTTSATTRSPPSSPTSGSRGAIARHAVAPVEIARGRGVPID